MKKRMISVLLVLTLVLSLFSGVGKAEAEYDKVYTYYDGKKLVTVQLDTTSAGRSVKGTPYGYESRGAEITLTDKDQIFAYSGASMDTHMGYYWSGASSASLWGDELNQGITDDVLKKFLAVGKDKDRVTQLELLEMVYKGLDIRGDWYVAVNKQAHYWVSKYPANAKKFAGVEAKGKINHEKTRVLIRTLNFLAILAYKNLFVYHFFKLFADFFTDSEHIFP